MPLQPEAWRHYLRACAFQLFRRPERAMAELRECLRRDADFAKAAHSLAYLLFTRNQHAEAEHYFRETLRVQPKNAVAWFNLGYLHERNRQNREAVEAFEQATRLDPKIDRAWYGLGLALAALGRHDDAARAFEEAARRQPMNGHAWYQLGMAYHALHQAEKVRDVIEHLNRFDRHLTRRLILDTGRSDLAHLIADFEA